MPINISSKFQKLNYIKQPIELNIIETSESFKCLYDINTINLLHKKRERNIRWNLFVCLDQFRIKHYLKLYCRDGFISLFCLKGSEILPVPVKFWRKFFKQLINPYQNHNVFYKFHWIEIYSCSSETAVKYMHRTLERL